MRRKSWEGDGPRTVVYLRLGGGEGGVEYSKRQDQRSTSSRISNGPTAANMAHLGTGGHLQLSGKRAGGG